MSKAREGNTVRVHYTGKLEDGTEFDSSADRSPLEFTIGQGEIIRGFEKAVVGMSPGESKTVTVPADDAYGQHKKEMVLVVDKNQLPSNLKPKVGERLEVRQADRTFTVLVTDITTSTVTLDANHPLAGKDLVFDIELVEIA